MKRIDSVEDVNQRLPEVERALNNIFQLNERSMSLSKDIRGLFKIWGNQLQKETNPDHHYYRERAMKKNSVNREIRGELLKIRELGGIVKDIRKGTVDFHVNDPELVNRVRELTENSVNGIFLCWRVGEEKIKHWHPAGGKYAKRRPLKELFEAALV